MAGSSLLALIDDISSLLDDVATLSKIAVKKTSGVVGDDLALNAEQVIGFSASRELPVVWAVAKGSFANKLILVPAALLISAFIPKMVLPLLMVGGIYLCYEGFEKVVEKLFHGSHSGVHESTVADAAEIDLAALERDRIKGAIRTDFILSAEIVVIALGTLSTQPMLKQILALSVIAILITVLVYGLVAAIVKLDDLGAALVKAGRVWNPTGLLILRLAPMLMRTLGVVGTLAMFLVGGSIIAHAVPAVEHLVKAAASLAGVGILQRIAEMLANLFVGVLAGAVVVAIVTMVSRLRRS